MHIGCLLPCLVLIILLHVLVPPTQAFLDPTPNTYAEHDPIPLKVNKITSTRTNIPFSYYSLPFCAPQDTHYQQENLAQILRGDHFEDSLYEIKTLEKIDCRIVNFHKYVSNSTACTEYSKDALDKFARKIQLEYQVHWSLDGLPAGFPKLILSKDPVNVFEKQYSVGFALGGTKDGVWINNHVDINIIYQDVSSDSSSSDSSDAPATDPKPKTPRRIVVLAFEVVPRSQWYDPAVWSFTGNYDGEDNSGDCPYDSLQPVSQSLELTPEETTKSIFWTYSVHWELSDNIQWKSRWDVYLRDSSTRTHLVSVLNAVIIVLFLMVVFVSILKRTLYPDASYDEDETKWKTLGSEAFRAPGKPLMLSVLIGSGAQIIGMALITTFFGILGLLAPARQGAYTGYLIGFFVTMSVFSGFFSMHFYKILRGTNKIHNLLATTFLYPTFFFFFSFVINFSERAAKSSATVPLSTCGFVVLLWFGISLPLVCIGSLLGYLKPLSEPRVHTNIAIRTIHRRVWYQRPFFSILFAGVLPFGVVVIEYFFILYSLYSSPIYNSYSYLLISLITLFITCACTNVVVIFFQLNSGDFQWWWRPWLHSAASAAYMFIYTTFIFFTNFKLIHCWEAIILYFAFATLASTAFFLMTGAVSFGACYIFVQAIYKHTNTHP